MALPTNIAAELRVLGALIEDDGLVHDIGLSVDDFVLSDHRRIFWAIVALHARNCPVDLFTAIEELGNSQEDYVVVASLVHGVVLHEDHTHNHAAIIRKKTRLRSLLKIAEWITESVNEDINPDAMIRKSMIAWMKFGLPTRNIPNSQE